MAQVSGVKDYKTFVKGIITEAGPLTFPENASIAEDNFVLNHDGSRQRRLGLDFEDNYVIHNTGVSPTAAAPLAISSHHWKNVADDANISFSVVQFGATLYIFDASKIDITANLIGTVDFTLKKTTYSATIGQQKIQTSTGAGVLLVTSKEVEPFYIQYNVDTSTFTTNTITVEIRDFFGVDDSLDVATRPSSLSVNHKYNLYNQGWPVNTYTGHINEAGTVVNTPSISDPLAQTYTTITAYPSNADAISIARKDTTAGGSTYIRYYEPDLLNKFDVGNTPAAKGHFVLNAFTRGASRNSLSGLTLIGDDYEKSRPQATAFFAGRAFFSGIESTSVTSGVHKKVSYNGFIFFSKIVQDLSDFGKCYQEADPTSEEISDLLETDGGTIHIPEAGRILKLVQRQNSLVVIADNGVWTVSGGELGFRATEFQVLKVTNIGAINSDSVVNAEGNVLYWSEGGIYALTADQVSLQLAAQNMTEGTIQDLYNGISNTAKLYCCSTFNASARQIRWLYNDTDTYNGIENRNRYNRELIYDAFLQAFYLNTIPSENPYISGYVETTLYKSEVDTQTIVVGTDTVMVGTDAVQVTRQITIGDEVKTKYLTIIIDTTIKGTISEFKSTTFKDWYSFDNIGQEYTSYLITGYEVVGDLSHTKQAPYIIFYFKRTETGLDGNGDLIRPSSALVQSRWDWTDSINSGKWSTQFQAYRLHRLLLGVGPLSTFDYGYSVIVTKNLIRGSGRALSLYISSESGKDMHILGWSSMFNGRTNV